MSALSVFLPKIYQYAPGCSEPAAFDGIRSAAITFCESTNLWRTKLTPPIGSANPIALTPIADSVIHVIETNLLDGCELKPKTTQWLDENCRGWRAADYTGSPSYITQTNEDQVSLVPFGGTALEVWVTLKPTQTAATLPDFIANRYMDAIQSGALSKILLLPKQPFRDPVLAAAFGASFQQSLDSLSSQYIAGQQRAPARSRSRFF